MDIIVDIEVRLVAIYFVGSFRYVASEQYAAQRRKPVFVIAPASLYMTSRCE